MRVIDCLRLFGVSGGGFATRGFDSIRNRRNPIAAIVEALVASVHEIGEQAPWVLLIGVKETEAALHHRAAPTTICCVETGCGDWQVVLALVGHGWRLSPLGDDATHYSISIFSQAQMQKIYITKT
jgi:hypothetical protein